MEIITNYLSDIQSAIHQLPITNIEKVINILHEARLNSQHVFILGNGGSSATASHFVCDLSTNTRSPGCPDFRAISLSDNTPAFSAYANDEGYETVFASQLRSLADPGDVLIAFSASGNSPNVLRALETANRMSVRTIGFTGHAGGRMKDMVELEVNVRNDRADQVEDIHLMLAHLISRVLADLAQPSIFLPRTTTETGLEQQVEGKIEEMIDQSLEKLQQFGDSITQKSDREDGFFGQILLKMIISFSAVSGSLVVLDEKGKMIDGILAYGDKTWMSDPRRMAEFLERGLASWVVKNRQGVIVTDTSTDSRWLKTWENGSLQSSYSVVSAPIRSNGYVMGVITLSRSNNDRFSEDDLSMLNTMLMALNYTVDTDSYSVKKQ